MWIATNQPHPTTHPRHQLPRKSLPSGLGICCSSLFENDAHFVWREGCGSDIFELCLIPFAKTWCSQRIMSCKGTKRTGIDMAGACKLQTLRPLRVRPLWPGAASIGNGGRGPCPKTCCGQKLGCGHQAHILEGGDQSIDRDGIYV